MRVLRTGRERRCDGPWPALLLAACGCMLPSCASIEPHPRAEATGRRAIDTKEAEPAGAPSDVESGLNRAASTAPEVESAAGQFDDARVRHTSHSAEVPPAPGDSSASAPWESQFTIADLERIALESNPTLAQAAAEIEKERGSWVQSGLYPNPTVGYVQSDATRSSESHTHGVLVQQTFITAGKLQKSRAIEFYGIQDLGWQLDAQQMRVLTDVRLRYFDALGAQQQVEQVEELRNLADRALKAAEALLKGEQVPKTDVLQAQAQLSQVELALDNARAERHAAWQRLAVIVGRPDLSPAELAAPNDDLPEFDFDDEWERLQSESPQLRSIEAQLCAAYSQLVRDQATPIPDVTVQVVGEYDRVMDYGTINTLIAVPLPLIDRNQGQIYTSVHEYHRARAEVERVRLVLRDQLVTTYRDYVQARNEALQLHSQILPRLDETLKLTMEGYERGEVDFLTVLSAQERYSRTRLNYETALTRARQIGAEIVGLQLTGGLNPATIGTAIQDAGGSARRRAVQESLERQNQGRINNFAPAALQ